MFLLSLSFSLRESSDIWQRLPRRWETGSYQRREGQDDRRAGRSRGKRVLKTKRQTFLGGQGVVSTMWTPLLSHSYRILSWNRYPSWSRGSSPILGEEGEMGEWVSGDLCCPLHPALGLQGLGGRGWSGGVG